MPATKNQNLSTDEQSCHFVSLLSFPLNVMSNVCFYDDIWKRSQWRLLLCVLEQM